ncbi:EAL domain-containing protein [Bacillus pinisoli]|uniref:EAL domain-containing protein n=1 Tax=Bacillus pinisoli TaxID=2901866 RepID=UPI001FF20D76|nr:EAL domain-containing protein [Bacillus pinisoli]
MFSSGSRARKLIGYLSLTILAIIGNYFNIELFLGIHFIFGSVFVLLIVHYYGYRWAILSAFLSGVYTIFLWDHLFGMLYYVMEALIVGMLYYKFRKNLVICALLYFVAIGIPFSYLTNMVFLHLDYMNSTMIMLKQGINAILNVVLANLAIITLEMTKIANTRRRISLQEITLNMLLIFFLIPVVSALILIGKDELQETKQHIKYEIDETTNLLKTRIEQIHANSLTSLYTAANKINVYGLESKSDIYTELMGIVSSNPMYEAIYVSDINGNVIQSYGKNAYNFYEFDFNNSFGSADEQGRPYLSNVFMLSPSHPTVSLTVPIVFNGNQIKGYVVGVIKPSIFKKAILDMKKDLVDITIIDRFEQIVATNKDNDQRDSQKLLISSNEVFYNTEQGSSLEDAVNFPQEWAALSYSKVTQISKEIPWSIHVKVPLTKYVSNLYNQFINLFILVFIVSGVTVIISFVLSKWIQRSFAKIADLTTNLPSKIMESDSITWPTMHTMELGDIVSNFKTTEHKLRNMFTEVYEAKQKLEFLAHYDQLTKLYNKTFLQHYFSENEEKQSFQRMALFFIDLDRFKIVNDTLGHESGDVLLLEVSERIKAMSNKEYIVSRMGGDEFIILIPDYQDLAEIESKAKQITSSLCEPYKLKGSEYFLSASIGISLYPENGKQLNTLIKNADIAMYTAKESGKNNYKFYNSEINLEIISKVEVENELRQAIEKNQLELYYQPQVNLETGKIEGVEALVRWFHPTLGFVSPGSFIPIAEETGLIIPIGEWILNKACRDLKTFQQTGGDQLTMSVNISMSQFLHSKLLQSVAEAINSSGISPRQLKLEITESVAMSQPDQVINKLEELKELGLELALDDFGTGYSSLNYLKRLPVDVLKIDRAFIQEIDQDDDDMIIVKALIEVAHSLDMVVIAEGVETKEQQDILRTINCDQMQGYYFSRPVAMDELEIMLKAKPTVLH